MTVPLYYDINSDIRQQPDYGKVFADAYQQGLQLQQQTQQAQSQKQVNQALSSGDYSTAQRIALGAGNKSAYDEAATVQQNQLAQAQQRLGQIANTAYSLKQLPAEQRPAAFESVKPMLKQLGFSDDQLSSVNLSDAGLEQYIGQALDLKTKIEMNKPMDVAPGHSLVNPQQPNKPLYSAAPELKYETITRPDGSTFIAAVNPYTNQGTSIGGGVPGQGQAPVPASGAPTAAPAATSPAPAGGDAGFQRAIATVLQNEGSKLVAHDGNGAPVRYGINQGANPDVDVANLTPDQAIQIYKSRYWDKSQAPNLPANMQTPYFDVYVRNPKIADKALAASGGNPAQFMQIASGYFNRLAQSPKFAQYQHAWNARDANNLQIATGGGQSSAPAQLASATPAPAGGGTLQDQISAFQSGGTHPHILSPDELKTEGYNPGAVVQVNAKGDEKVTQKGNNNADTAPLGPQALDAQTEQAILNPKSLILSGMATGKAKIQIANREPAVLAKYNLTPQDVPQVQNLYAADSKAVQARTNQVSFLNQSYTQAQAHAQTISTLVDKLAHQNNIKVWNQAAQAYLEHTNDPTWISLKKAVSLYNGEVARVMTGNPQSGAGQLTNEAQAEVNILTPGVSPTALKASLATQDQMMRAKVAGPETDLQRLKARQAAGLAGYAQLIHGGKPPQQQQQQQNTPRTIVRSGIQKSTGKRVVQYSDGSIEVQ